jgi:hypothetical protein
LWKNFDQKVVAAGKWGMIAGTFWIFCGFDVHFASFSVWNLVFLRNVRAFHFCSMRILTTTAFHSPKDHFHGGNADIFPLCWNFPWFSKLLRLRSIGETICVKKNSLKFMKCSQKMRFFFLIYRICTISFDKEKFQENQNC